MLYYPDGSIIENLDEFVNFYNHCYYLKNSKFSEEQIEKILDRSHHLTEQDVMSILRWKFGRIDHKQTASSGNQVIYNAKDYIDSFNGILKAYSTWDEYGREVNAEKICKYIARHYKCENTNYEDIYSTLADQPKEDTKNMGPVYLLTLVSFITRGLCPIYDRFALQAIEAIKATAIKPGQSAPIGELIQDLDKHNKSEIIRLYKEYIYSIKCVFGTKYQYNRDVDRALWFYGHLFR